MTGVYFMPRAAAARARTLGAERRVIAPAARLSDRAERMDRPVPAKLSNRDALVLAIEGMVGA